MAASSRTCSGPNAPFDGVHRDRLIAPTMREASARLSPAAAAVMIHTAQDGKLSITDVPPLHWRGGWSGDSQQPVNPCPDVEDDPPAPILERLARQASRACCCRPIPGSRV